MPQPLEQQRRSNPLTPCIGRGFALDQRQHHRTLRQPDDRARQPVEITARNDHFLAPEIGDDALLGATLLAYVLDQVDVGVGANALVASEHTLSILGSFPIVKRYNPSPHYNLAPHFRPGFINLQHFCHSRWRNPVRLSKSGLSSHRRGCPTLLVPRPNSKRSRLSFRNLEKSQSNTTV